MIAHVALGSNLGDREALLGFGVRELAATPGLEILAASSIYETRPVGLTPQSDPQPRYLNAVIRIASELDARSLLERLLAIEKEAGRDRSGEGGRLQSRTLDLDLLFYGDCCIDEPGLSVPHPRLHERAFVLEPLCEVSPDVIHPRLKKPIATFAAALHDPVGVQLWSVPLVWRDG